MDIDFGNRKELFRALVGSHNYNMNTPESDKDYKIFIAPTFDDLYFNRMHNKMHVGFIEDYDVHDIRHASHLWWKSNINFLEVLFTEEKRINPNLDPKTQDLILKLFAIKEDIARMNLPYLYNACIGMHLSKKGQVHKGTSGTLHLVDKFGYDTKQAMHSLRVLNFLQRYVDNGFSDFKQAIWYEDKDIDREELLSIKHGELTLQEYKNLALTIFTDTEAEVRELYIKQEPNEETKEKVLEIIKEIVRLEIKEQ